MHSEEDVDLSPEERLEALLFQYAKLYERWSEDRQVLMKQAADMAKGLQRWDTQLALFEQIDVKFRHRLSEFIHQEAAAVGEQVGKALGQSASQAASQQVKATTVALDQAVSSAQAILHQQTNRLHGMTTYFWIITFVISLLGGLTGGLLVHRLMADSAEWTAEQQENQGYGEFVRDLWPKLSEKEQRRLLAISRKTLHSSADQDENDFPKTSE